jgi:hypothetical protein
MLRGFENTTCDITDYEKDILVPVFIEKFTSRIGKGRAVSNAKIIKSLREQKFKIGDGTRIRKIINYIRKHHLTEGCLIANSKGYYISFNPVEIKEYLGTLEGREGEIRKVKESIKDYLNKKIIGHQSQLNL